MDGQAQRGGSAPQESPPDDRPPAAGQGNRGHAAAAPTPTDADAAPTTPEPARPPRTRRRTAKRPPVTRPSTEGAISDDDRSLLVNFLDGLPVAAFVIDAEGRPFYANSEAVKVLGRGVDPSVGVDWLSEAYPSFVAGTQQRYPPENMPIVRVLRGEEQAHVDDVELERHGRRIPIEAWARPIRDRQGTTRFAIAVFHDVSGRRRAEAERVERARERVRLNEALRFEDLRRRFVNHAAHQLATPLTPIKLHVARLEARKDPQAPLLHRNVERLEAVIRQILRVGELGARRKPPTLAHHRMSDVAAVAGGRCRAAAQRKGVQVTANVPDVRVPCDASMVEEALYQLLDNAIRASPPGGEVRVTARVAADDVEFRVHDHGNGWAPGSADALVPQSDVAELAADAPGQGWGMGLLVARSVAAAHGGGLAAHSPGPDRGATFSLRLLRRARLPTPEVADAEPSHPWDALPSRTP